MADVNALVVFYSRRGLTEALALAAGLGALQAKADIRLRRVAGRADPREIETDAEWKQALERMHKEYVEPRPADGAWADLVVLATPSDAPDEIIEYVVGLRAPESPKSKTAAPIVFGGDGPVLDRLRAACTAAGLRVPDGGAPPLDAAAARAYGRRMVEAVRAARG